MNQTAYRLALVKDSGSDDYRSRIGFNLGSLSIGYYTFVCEFFPVVMLNVSVTARATTISINSQTTKTFPTYTKTLVQFHRWNSTPPQFIYLDLHGSAPGGGSRVLAHMVVYGVKGYVPNVLSTVFEQVYVVENRRMKVMTDFDLHGHRLLNNGRVGFSFNSDGAVSLNENLNTNSYRVVGIDGGGFEVDDNGRVKMHEDLDLNGHGIHEVLSFQSGKMLLHKNLDLNGKVVMENNRKVFEFRIGALQLLKPLVFPGMSVWV